MTSLTSVHLAGLGCARNDVDSEELAARLELGGFRLVEDPADAEVVVVNTCGFIESAKKDSIDTLLAAADLKQGGRTRAVVAVGCLAERYGVELAEALPEADAVLGFDEYPLIASRLRQLLAGDRLASHRPRDRRTLLPLAPAQRHSPAAPGGALTGPGAAPGGALTGPGGVGFDLRAELPDGLAPASGPRPLRRRLDSSPMAPLKIASGCDRRCAFCAIPAFRGSYLSRRADEILGEARWLVDQGVRELLLVSENTSSYGKDLGELRALEALLPSLARIEGLAWIRVSYLQPAEVRPSLLEVMASTPGVVPYYDLSFQHAAPAVLRRMRRFGDPDSFLALIERIRELTPTAGIRSNVIVGFPGETERDLELLTNFLSAAELDVTGVFGYSDEEGTEAAGLTGKLPVEQIEQRRAMVADLVEELCEQRAAARCGESSQFLVEELDEQGPVGRCLHQGPEVDGSTRLVGQPRRPPAVGELLEVRITGNEGVDLLAVPAG